MDINKLKHVVGQAQADKPAIIRFFDSVHADSTSRFNDEFLWLQDYVKPSKIIVMINSEGGSVLHGMSSFSIIQACPIEVDCVVEGIAASMGSVLWAAGDNLFMHDYSLLMIHNPFNSGNESDLDDSVKQTVQAFKHQLEVIYKKRFGMTQQQVADIMNGEGNADGTFFTAKQAVAAGLLDKTHVIKTSKAIREKVSNQIDGIVDKTSLRDIMSAVSVEVDQNKLLKEISAIHNRKDNQNFQQSQTMNDNPNFNTISALLGLTGDIQATHVTARITELIKNEAELKAIQDKHKKLEIKCTGVEADLTNTKKTLQEAQASLKKYQDAEQAAFEAKVEQTIEAAIKAGKIENSAKESWVKMAHTDFETVQATLDSIQGRDDITNKISTDPQNITDTQNTLQTVEEKQADKVKEVCGQLQFLTDFA